MPPRRGRPVDGAVRGPTSALTSFLAGLGVEAPNTNIYARREEPTDEAPPPPPPEDEEVARPGKRRRAISVDSDDLDDAPGGDDDSDEFTPAASGSVTPASVGAAPSILKAIGEMMECGECGRRFPVTQYTKEHPRKPRTWLCTPCCRPLGIDPYAKAKKPRGKAAAAPAKAKKDARNKIVHYEVTKGVPVLSQICIEIIGRFIEDVEALGEIGADRMDHVCKVISKSRRLTPETAKLFFSADRTELTMYDVTNLDHNAFVTLGLLCPNLESLNLQYCGQMMTDTLVHWAKQLRKLKHLELFGPFLVRKEGWIEFFKARGKELESLSITQSPRIDLETIEVLVKHCPNLRVLKLAEIGQMDSDFLAPLAKLNKLESLAISSPGTAISDDAVETLLTAVGKNLSSLDLGHNTELSDEILTSIAGCPKLTSLALAGVDLSDAGVGRYFQTLKSKKRPGLVHIDLEKGHDLAHEALTALIAHSGSTVCWLSLKGWRNVPADDVALLAGCPNLSYLDLGWCRHITDFTLKDILEGCPALKHVRVWGCNNLTDRVPRRRGVKVVGIETHAI
ncbi:RNI-like protein [Cutaneotrichosporon oleaginosum]|uniref:RNI-like protein n=1 Tax=Cutaneotrichosporon oleaginosum TaxID=879819 RepID=A0A0J0XWM8_9TREE|nr:RNI-like protein [Cutaneotrichosporon oleaginosum]KLT45453.1 RNI-like protein [Cutaneotrichosporon oleaginosum]TXT14588.1 hypothetical protein COLE_00781 [Cutaneotrichosporon oleaginosum]